MSGTRKQKELTSLSFFSGCLGLDLGLEKAGIHQLLACDFDKHCRNTISANRPDIPVIDDLNNFEADDIRKIAGLKKNQRPTLIVGGPPCQAFSTAGKRQAFTDPRGNVFLKYIQLIEDLQPDYAVIENVRGLLSAALKHRSHDERGKDFPPLTDDELPGGALFYVLNWLNKIGVFLGYFFVDYSLFYRLCFVKQLFLLWQLTLFIPFQKKIEIEISVPNQGSNAAKYPYHQHT